MEGELIRTKVKIVRQFYPKNNKHMESGDWGIVSVTIIDCLEGNPVINPIWNTITIKGVMPEWEHSKIYTLIAKEGKDEGQPYPTYEIIKLYTEIKLDTLSDQKAFLSNFLTKIQLDSMYSTLDNPMPFIMEHDIKSLCKIKGVGEATANRIIKKYEDNKDYTEVYVGLSSLGLTSKMIRKLCDSYSNPTILLQKIKSNPYIIADEVNGVGWVKADEIALKSGISKNSPIRIEAYIQYRLNKEANENGNVWVWTENLVEDIESLFEGDVTFDSIMLVFSKLMEEEVLWSNPNRAKIGLKKYVKLEDKIATEITRLVNGEVTPYLNDWCKIVKDLEDKQGWKYTEQQLEGIKATLENNVVLITGYGGCGKTAIVKAMLNVLKGENSAQCALSGRASVNLTEITGQEGFTIHRLLGFNPDMGFLHSKTNPLEQDIVILDELSMVDDNLFYKLIQSIQDNKKLIMLGDYGQLENLGVGNIIRDLIDSKVVKHVELTEIHRQAKKSSIITDSIKVWNGMDIIEKGFTGHEIRGELQDLELDISDNKNDTANKIMYYFKELYKQCDNIKDIVVALPMKENGEACTRKINNKIQHYLRKKHYDSFSEKGITTTLYTLYEGDRVMNVMNNYKTIRPDEENKVEPIMNGDMGIIKTINPNKSMIIDFDRMGEILVPPKWRNHIELSYSATVHKLQGASAKYVILALDNSHYLMRTKEMLYTMITRAKKHCVLIGENTAIRYAIKHSGSRNRNTLLKSFLQGKQNIINSVDNSTKE